MKTKQKFLKTVLTVLILATYSCGQNQTPLNEGELPSITQTGKNIFGCIIDGEVLIPKDRFTGSGGIISRRIGLRVSIDKSNYFSVRAVNALNDRNYIYIYIYIYIHDLTEEGVYQLSDGKDVFDILNREPIIPKPKYHFSYIERIHNGKIVKRYASYENSGIVTITRYDKESKIYSGTFSFKAVNADDPTDVIEIIDGRFDVDLNTLYDREY